jgi:hypothetical protein
MIRRVVIHMQGEQPLVADLQALPNPSDASIVCTNLRTSSGQRPTFVDHMDSWFVIPLGLIRFVEIPAEALSATELPGLPAGPEPVPELEELDVDEDFLRRIREA